MPELQLEDGSRIAVIGSGPAGSLFTYFFSRIAGMVGLEARIDLYDPRDYSRPGPCSCNHCGGIISESLVQLLATEGINLPDRVVRRGLDSYVLHTDVGSVRIETPLQEKRIAAVYRGAGPKGSTGLEAGSFDAFLQGLAIGSGARLIQERVDGFERSDGRPVVRTRKGGSETYDLLVGAVGVNTSAPKLFESLGFGYVRPGTAKTYISEILLGEDTIRRKLGTSMHVFLLDLPRLEFAALIPKGDYLTLCLLGTDIDKALIEAFVSSPEVRRCLPPEFDIRIRNCNCSPKINLRSASQPFGDRVVLIGDCGTTRLYKDGIGAAYRTAKAAATTAVLHGIANEDFRSHYWSSCRGIEKDNAIGKRIFSASKIVQRARPLRRGILRMVAREQSSGSAPRMSTAVWDLFTGSAPYADILRRTVHPGFVARFLWNVVAGVRFRSPSGTGQESLHGTGMHG